MRLLVALLVLLGTAAAMAAPPAVHVTMKSRTVKTPHYVQRVKWSQISGLADAAVQRAPRAAGAVALREVQAATHGAAGTDGALATERHEDFVPADW